MYYGKERRLTLINELRTRHIMKKMEAAQGAQGQDKLQMDDLEGTMQSPLALDIQKGDKRRQLIANASLMLPLPGEIILDDDRDDVISLK
jgi:hypothetical protein